jgi:hypothetical protein
MIPIVICCLALMSDGATSVPLPASSPAAWIAVLREHERTQGRDAWSWLELYEARTAVFDSRYAAPVLAGWAKTGYMIYLRYAPFLLGSVMLGGLWLAWRWGKSFSWGTSVSIALIWMALIWLIIIPLQSDQGSFAVIKTAGVMLRQGNGQSYALTLYDGKTIALASGVEAQLLAEQPNGWVQIMMQDGTRGWVPKDTVYLAGQ